MDSDFASYLRDTVHMSKDVKYERDLLHHVKSGYQSHWISEEYYEYRGYSLFETYFREEDCNHHGCSASLNGEEVCEFNWDMCLEQCCMFIDHLLSTEDDIPYLKWKCKAQEDEIKKLRDSASYYRDAYVEKRNTLSDTIIHTFMPKDYKNAPRFGNSTPYRRGIANSLFLLDKRGYLLPDDVKPFMVKFKTKKTTRR